MRYTFFSLFQALLWAYLPRALASPLDNGSTVLEGTRPSKSAVFLMIFGIIVLMLSVMASMMNGNECMASSQRDEAVQAAPPETTESALRDVLNNTRRPASAAVPLRVILPGPYSAAQHGRTGVHKEVKA
ncbi:hypothetical protein DENSPDRAFT_838342 [Dentipellis sp. KUC8613]|nr:hypothetical protein DENSPDRAFT_838342 [Dentipellis sp. KUC8613]